jgi:hypothetical protein
MGSKSSPSDIVRIENIFLIRLFLIIFFLKINLKLILVSGKTAEFQFRPTTTASDVAKYVFENWPEGKIK